MGEEGAHRRQPADLVEGAAQLGLEEDDGGDEDRLAAVGEDELQQTEVELLGGEPEGYQDDQADQQLHRLGAADQLEDLIDDQSDDGDVEDVPPAQVAQEDVDVGEEAHGTA